MGKKNNIGDERFVMEVAENGCVERIRPLTGTVTANLTTIGGIIDENSHLTKKMSEFFDPGICGDCHIYDGLSHEMRSLRYHGGDAGDWEAAQKWEWEKNHWEWSFEVRHLAGPERELCVKLSLPHPVFPGPHGSGHSNWSLWVPLSQKPLGNDYGIARMHHSKCVDEKTDIPLPLFTLFHSTKDISLGLSYLLPPDQTWYTDFEIDQRNWTVNVTFNNLGLIKGGSVRLHFWLFSHEGDWRPALGWVRKQFPKLLGPVPGQEKIEGNMAYTIPMIPEKRIRDWSVRMHLRWNELFYCRNFGDYFPAEPFDANHFKTPAHPERSADNLTYDDINRYIDLCHKYDVRVTPYFNIGECESEIAWKNFPETIVKIFNGAEVIPWTYADGRNHNILMNSDPKYPFFDFVMSQFEKLLKRCPGIDGFFFDQMGYGWIDVAHSDGLTFYNNRPAYNLSHMYMRALKKMREIFPRPRIAGMANGVMRWQLMEYVDGVMAEGDPHSLGCLSMLAPARPTICLAEGENAFQMALYYGSWLHVSPYYRYPTEKPLPKDALKLFSNYVPLFEFLEGREWVYSPNPLHVTVNSENIYKAPLLSHGEQVRSNIFRMPQGGYAIIILAVPKGVALRSSKTLPVTARIRVPAAGKLKHVITFGADYKGYSVGEVHSSDDGIIEVSVPKHGAATMILLTNDFTRLKRMKNWTKFSEQKTLQ